MDIYQVRELLQRYQAGNCTPSEIELIEGWYQQLIDTGEFQWDEGEKEMMQGILEARIMKQINDSPKVTRLSYSRWWAAAAVIFLLGAVTYYVFYMDTTKPPQMAEVSHNDIKAPQSNSAVITLANGEKIYLDSAANGTAVVQGNVKLVKLKGGEIAYQQHTGEESREMQYNTLANPRGSKVIHVILEDGSKVWLNAGSALTYPVAFIGDKRSVSISGEAYFEIAHNAAKPFIVNKDDVEIQVLGTHFNVNAFEDAEEGIKVTLLEGAVKINSGNAKGLLKPGQQALVDKEIKVTSEVDLDFVMAWKNGYFQFDKASLQNVLKQVSRWYDVEVVYEGSNQSRQFQGEVQKDLNLSEMLKILEKNNVQFRIEGKKLIVIPD